MARRRSALSPSKPLAETEGCGRRRRVVLAPVAGVKFAEASRPTGHRQNLNPRTTVTRRIRRRGEHEISRKPLRAGMPGYSGGPVVTTLVCLFLSHTRLRVHWPPGIPHALVFSRAND